MFGLVAIVLLAGVVIGGLYAYENSQKQLRADTLAEVAGKLGLAFDQYNRRSEGRMTGRVNGVEVTGSVVHHHQGKSEVAWIRVEASPSVPLPKDLALLPEGLGSMMLKAFGGQDVTLGDPELDDSALVRCAVPAHVQDLFQNDRLRIATCALFTSDPHNGVKDGCIGMESRSFRPKAVQTLVDKVVEAALAFEEALVGSWQRLADTEGLNLTHDNGTVRAEGTLSDGLRCVLKGSFSAGRTSLRVTTPHPVVGSLRVVSGDHSGARVLGDPILDGRVSATGDAIDGLRALLCTDEIRGELMEVLQRFPESWVEGPTVVLMCHAATFDSLSARLLDARRLATALGKRASHLQ